MAVTLAGTGCRRPVTDPQTVTVLVESSPANLDPRIGTDAVSQRIDELIFDGLLDHDASFTLQPALAQSWTQDDALTYTFVLRGGVRFHNGQPLTANDVIYTLNSLRDGSIVTAKGGAFKSIQSIESIPSAAPPGTAGAVRIHLKEPDPALLWTLSSGACGIVPAGSGKNFSLHPIGTGPFTFVRQETDSEVVLRRNDHPWSTPAKIEKLRFAVVPDAITAALELRKGTADASLNFLTPDMTATLARDPRLRVLSSPGTRLQYLGFNLRDPLLSDVRVRRAIALTIDRGAIIRYLLAGHARPAESLLPPNHWAFDANLLPVPFDPVQANTILDAAGYKRGADGIRFHLTMKTSTDENARVLSAVLQQQLRAAGIALDLRSFEFATFYADIVRGAFQVYSLRWIGGNEDPDIFRYAFSSAALPPKGANRGFYQNAAVDADIADARAATGRARQTQDYLAIQQKLSQDLPTIDLWYVDNVAVVNRRLQGVILSSSGDYTFLKTASIAH